MLVIIFQGYFDQILRESNIFLLLNVDNSQLLVIGIHEALVGLVLRFWIKSIASRGSVQTLRELQRVSSREFP